jgi:precorrin-6A/cobalt-precorrin-6A reductase
VPQEGDRWLSVPTLTAAAEILPGLAQRIFLAIGRQDLMTFAHLRDLWFLMRLLEVPSVDAVLPCGEILYGRPPFTVEQERAWMLEHGIDAMVSKNSGGSTDAKLQVARELGLPVVMVERPLLPEGHQVSTVAAAVEWVLRL